jgi:hypothetical protein
MARHKIPNWRMYFVTGTLLQVSLSGAAEVLLGWADGPGLGEGRGRFDEGVSGDRREEAVHVSDARSPTNQRRLKW